ncbi:MAG: DUF4423 domain-containing protein [Bdellovibrionaceae bacterium]|nr:DUF4423 domain-containing protein [Bdellovibrionales bacterium]MCB9084044.1 DUF4423 domain-containing protein [Pseudobdellovibrionaceae bacterium]
MKVERVLGKVSYEKQEETELGFETSAELKRHQELQKKYTGNWLWRTLAGLVSTADFDPSLSKLAARLRVSVNEVVEAFEGLEQLGIIRRTAEGYERVLKYVYFSDRDLDPGQVLADHVLISTQVLGRLDPLNPELNSFYRTGFIASNEKAVRKFCRQMEEIMKAFLMESAAESADGVYGFTFSSVEVSGRGEKGEVQ